MKRMSKQNGGVTSRKNGHPASAPDVPLVTILRQLKEKYVASGGKLLNRRELEKELADLRR